MPEEKQPDIVRVTATEEKFSEQAQLLTKILNSEPMRSKILADMSKAVDAMWEHSALTHEVVGKGWWRK